MLKRLRKRRAKANLKYFDVTTDFRERYFFIKNVIRNSFIGVFWSVLILILLCFLDWGIKKIVFYLYSFPDDSIWCKVAQFCFYANNKIGVKNIQYLSEVVSLGAGVLGVLLGLFYTVFVTIVSTKYSNVNSVISLQLLQQKNLNRYFVLLSTLASLSVLFQFLLALNYKPTIVSFSVFTFLVVAALTSFVKYGKFFLVYFDTSYLVAEIISDNERGFRKIAKQKKSIDTLEKGRAEISRINKNLEKIRVIILESSNPQTTNTSLDSISKDLLNFSASYFRKKHIIPSAGWHIQEQHFTSWDDAQSYDFEMLQSTGVGPLPKLYDSYNFIERKIVDIQFELFQKYIGKESNVFQLLQDQYSMLQLSSIQCDIEYVKHFFKKLEEFIIERIDSSEDKTEKLQLVSVIVELLLQYIVGFNYLIPGLTSARLKKLANTTYHFKDTNRTFHQFPYFIRIWVDTYQGKLIKEKSVDLVRVTPLFYSEYDLANTIQLELQNYVEEYIIFCNEYLENISKTLLGKRHNVEALALNLWSIELSKKINYMLELVGKKIEGLNDLNFQKSSNRFSFSKSEELSKRNTEFNAALVTKVWDLGIHSYNMSGELKTVSDIFGTVYHTILQSILDLLLAKELEIDKISERLVKFNALLVFYVDHIKEKYSESKSGNFELLLSRIYPLIMDMFDINSVAIIVGRLNNEPQLEISAFEFFEKLDFKEDNELKFWTSYLSIHTLYNQHGLTFSNSSFQKEHNRLRQFGEYLVNHPSVKKEDLKSEGFNLYTNYYTTDIEDLYLKAVLASIDGYHDHFSTFKLSEVFIEFYLRTRIGLRGLEIKETSYGEKLRRTLERTNC